MHPFQINRNRSDRLNTYIEYSSNACSHKGSTTMCFISGRLGKQINTHLEKRLRAFGSNRYAKTARTAFDTAAHHQAIARLKDVQWTRQAGHGDGADEHRQLIEAFSTSHCPAKLEKCGNGFRGVIHISQEWALTRGLLNKFFDAQMTPVCRVYLYLSIKECALWIKFTNFIKMNKKSYYNLHVNLIQI